MKLHRTYIYKSSMDNGRITQRTLKYDVTINLPSGFYVAYTCPDFHPKEQIKYAMEWLSKTASDEKMELDYMPILRMVNQEIQDQIRIWRGENKLNENN